MSDERQEGEALTVIGQKRQNTDNGGPASKKANVADAGK
jgi:hypothetical protein